MSQQRWRFVTMAVLILVSVTVIAIVTWILTSDGPLSPQANSITGSPTAAAGTSPPASGLSPAPTTDGSPSTAPAPVPTEPSQPPSVQASASGSPGANVLAAAGTGPSTARFTPSTASWALHTTYTCAQADPGFTLVLRDSAGTVIDRIGGGLHGDEHRTFTGAGPFLMTVTGPCSWTIDASG